MLSSYSLYSTVVLEGNNGVFPPPQKTMVLVRMSHFERVRTTIVPGILLQKRSGRGLRRVALRKEPNLEIPVAWYGAADAFLAGG